jgi:hypothetical protein
MMFSQALAAIPSKWNKDFPTMSHAGFSPEPDDTPSEHSGREAGADPRRRAAHIDAACGVYHRDGLAASDNDRNRPAQTTREDESTPRESLPFIVQAGQILFLVAEERDDWVLAELRFDAATCTFAEERRTRFQWPREVFGRLLSRTIVGNDIDLDEATRVADAFTQWLSSQYVTARHA